LAPVLNDYFGALAEQTRLDLDDPHMEALREAVAADEAAFALIDAGELAPSADPWDFVRSLRANAKTDGA
jgi:hypothetical protein